MCPYTPPSSKTSEPAGSSPPSRVEQIYETILKRDKDLPIWLATPNQISFDSEGQMTIILSGEMMQDSFRRNYGNVLEKLAKETGPFTKINWVVDRAEYEKIVPKEEIGDSPLSIPRRTISAAQYYATAETEAALAKLPIKDAIGSGDYVRGNCNAVSFAKGFGMLDRLKAKKTPQRSLLVYGGNNLGKTTLLKYLATEAIAAGLIPFFLDINFLANQYQTMARRKDGATPEDWKNVDFSHVQHADLVLLDGLEGLMTRGNPKTRLGTQRKALELMDSALNRGKGLIFTYSGTKEGWTKLVMALAKMGQEEPDEHYKHLAARLTRASRTQLVYPSGEGRIEFVKDAILSLSERCNDQLDPVARHISGLLGRNADPGRIMVEVEELADYADMQDKEITLGLTRTVLGTESFLIETPGQLKDELQTNVTKIALDLLNIKKPYVAQKGREPDRVDKRGLLIAARRIYTDMTPEEIVADLPISSQMVRHALIKVEELTDKTYLNDFLTQIEKVLLASGQKVEKRSLRLNRQVRKPQSKIEDKQPMFDLKGSVADIRT